MILAYLDPGSGSALVGTLIAVAGAALYSLKSFFYRLIRKGDKNHCQPQPSTSTSIAIFSEGKNYWGTFKLIVEELIARKVHFAYYTMDLHDPALLIDNEFMHARLYDKRKPSSYHHLSNLKADVLLATSPNIGTPGFPIKRSPNVKNLVHVFHAFADISAYHIGSLDHYDTVLTVGPHQEKPIREVEKARNLPAKTLIPMGLPYFDAQFLTQSHRDTENSTSSIPTPTTSNTLCASPCLRASVLKSPTTSPCSPWPTILIGPSWGAKGLLKEYGTQFIIDLAKAGYNVIVRPHPQSYIAEPDFIKECQAATSAYPNIVWDSEVVGTRSMLASSLLISDTSSLRFDYAFLYAKPVITLDIPRDHQLEYEGQFMSSIWTDAIAPSLGRVLTHADFNTESQSHRAEPLIVSVVHSLLSPTPTPTSDSSSTSSTLLHGQSSPSVPPCLCVKDSLASLRSTTITNLGTSHRAIVDYLTTQTERRQN